MSDSERKDRRPAAESQRLDPAESASDTDLFELFGEAGPRPEPPPEEVARIKEAVSSHWRSRLAEGSAPAVAGPTASGDASPGSVRSVLGWLAAAAVLVVVAGWWWLARPEVRSRPPAGTVELAEDLLRSDGGLATGTDLAYGRPVATGPTGRLALRLATGHSLRLAPNSAMTVADEGRVRLHRGAVYVDSGKRPRIALRVVTLLGSVTEVGTRFEVALVESDDARLLRTRVRSGEVLLTVPGEGEGGNAAQAEAGEELAARGSAITRSSTAVWGDEWAWVLAAAPRLPLEETTAADLLQWLSREMGRELVYRPSELRTLAVSTRIEASVPAVSPELALELLPAAGLAAALEDGRLVVRDLRSE